MSSRQRDVGHRVSGREIAFLTLERFEKSRRPADELLQEVLACHSADGRETGLAFSLVQGVLRRRGFLDAVLDGFSTVPASRMQRQVLLALRLALFQILFLDRVPDHAAINESILLLQRSRQPRRVTGFVNGVLRAVCRARDTGAFPPAMAAHQFHSHPRWLYDRYLARYGQETAGRLCESNNTPPELHLAVDPRHRDGLRDRLLADHIAAAAGSYCADSLILHEFSGSPTLLPGFAEGWFHIQDQGAQLIPHLATGSPAGPVLDGCAGLGGKSIGLARLLPDCPVTALEPHRGRFALLGDNLARTRTAGRITPVHGRLQEFAAGHQGPPFQAILLDVPCSGLGVVRRHPEIRWLRQEADLAAQQAAQLQLLLAAVPLLAARGVLVYATCSTEPEENEEVVRLFLARHPEFRIDDARPHLPESARSLVDAAGCLRTRPDLGECDGFFAVRLSRDIPSPDHRHH